MSSATENMQSERGQSLALILIVLVIGAIVAFAIAARTIQDIRRTSQERISDQAGAQVETYLDAVTSDLQWDQLVGQDGGWLGGGLCDGAGDICELDSFALQALFGGLVCDEATVKLRQESDIIDLDVPQDDVLEVNLGDPDVAGSFSLEWSGSDHLLVNVYMRDPNNGEVSLYQNAGAPIGFTDRGRVEDGVADNWGTLRYTDDGTPEQVNYPAHALFARIRPIRGNANITVTNIPPQEMTVKASCFYEGVYREFVRRVPLYDSVPACFDYVLFDGSSMIDEF